MKLSLWPFIFVILFLTNCSQTTKWRTPSSENSPLHLVFDIDWTLVIPLKEKSHHPFEKSGRLFQSDGKYYLLKEGMLELIELAHKRNLTISFFSGGKKSRNVDLLKKIKLPQGRSLFEISHQILSFEDLTLVSGDMNLRFSERYKKDISKIHSEVEKVILFEDIPHFAKGQGQRQTAYLGETTFPLIPGHNLESSRAYWKKFGIEDRYLPQSIEHDWWQRRKPFLMIQQLESQNPEAQKILDQLLDEGFSEAEPPNKIHEKLMESATYQRFLKDRPCPRLLL